MKCHHLLNIPVSSLIQDTSLIPRIPNDFTFWTTHVNPKLFLKANVYDKLLQLGNLSGLIFEMKPKSNKEPYGIHIDLITTTLQPAWPGLNIIFEGQGTMKWFKPDTDGVIVKKASPNIAYVNWLKDYGEPIDIWNKGKVALVRTDVAHQGWNDDDTNRFLVSIRWSNRTTWEETIEWFNRNFPDEF